MKTLKICSDSNFAVILPESIINNMKRAALGTVGLDIEDIVAISQIVKRAVKSSVDPFKLQMNTDAAAMKSPAPFVFMLQPKVTTNVETL